MHFGNSGDVCRYDLTGFNGWENIRVGFPNYKTRLPAQKGMESGTFLSLSCHCKVDETDKIKEYMKWYSYFRPLEQIVVFGKKN